MDRVPNLPSDLPSKPIIFELNNDAIPVYEVAIHGSAPYDLKRQYAKVLEQRLRTNPNVGEITKLGYRDLETQILLNPFKLNKHYVSLGEVLLAVQSNNIYSKAGDSKPFPYEKNIVINTEYKTVKDLKNVIVRSGFEGNRVKIKDLAIINKGYEDLENIIRYNGKDSINLVIQKKPDADITKTSADINAIIKTLKKELPDSIKIEPIVDYSIDTFNLLKLVRDNAVIGLILILVTLILLLNARIAFWTAFGIPIAILMGFSLFPLFDVTINFISLVAILIVLGMLVDDAILVSENIFIIVKKDTHR